MATNKVYKTLGLNAFPRPSGPDLEGVEKSVSEKFPVLFVDPLLWPVRVRIGSGLLRSGCQLYPVGLGGVRTTSSEQNVARGSPPQGAPGGGAAEGGASFEEVSSAEAAARGAHVVYARSWGALESYGQPTIAAHRVAQSRDWLVDENLMKLGDDARPMHPMPVRRNLEVTDEVIDGPRSLVYTQAANRLPTQKGLLSLLLRG